MGMRDLLHSLINHVNWRDEADLVQARAEVDEEYPPPSHDNPDEPETKSTKTAAGVKNADGSAHKK